tara:strand:- start:2112 stop:2492 length:381 start_codon:yes stop_codon:yes gene_type:complete
MIIKKKNDIEQKKNELVVLQNNVKEKATKDIANYGKPLGNSQLTLKVARKIRTIKKLNTQLGKLEDKLNERLMKKHGLTKHDEKVLSAIRSEAYINNTSTDNTTSRVDNRWNGSANSRRTARKYNP